MVNGVDAKVEVIAGKVGVEAKAEAEVERGRSGGARLAGNISSSSSSGGVECVAFSSAERTRDVKKPKDAWREP